MGLLIRIIATAVAFFVVAYFLPQVEYGGDYVQLAILAGLFGVVNALIKPIVKAISMPINFLTLGLFGVVVNAALFLGVAYAADAFGVPVSIGGFPPDLTADAIVAAVIGSIGVSIVGTIIGLVVPD